jgi:hypothetical protein
MFARRFRMVAGLVTAGILAAFLPVSVQWRPVEAGSVGLPIVEVKTACAQDVDPPYPWPPLLHHGCAPSAFRFCTSAHAFQIIEDFTCVVPELGCLLQ